MQTTYKKTADRVNTILRAWTDAAELYAARAAAEHAAEQTARAAQAAYFAAVNDVTGKAAAESAEHIDRLLTAAEHAADAAAARAAAELYAAEKRVAANSAETIARIKAAAERAEKAKAARKARAEKRAAQDAAARAKVDAMNGGKMPDVTPPPEHAAAVDETARAEHVARLQAAAAADAQTEKRREQWAHAIRAAAAAYTYVNMPAQDAAAVAVYVTLKHIRRRPSVSAAAVKQAEQWTRELTAARAAEFDRAALQNRINAAAAREQTAADAAARIKDAAARDDKTAQAAAEHAAAPYESAARYYHAARADAQKRYDELCAEQFGFGVDLWNTAVACITDFAARGLSVADIDLSPTGRPFCVWTRVASTIQLFIRAQKTAPSTPKTGNVTARDDPARDVATVNAKGSDRPRKGHDAEHAAARAELSEKLSAALATLSPRDAEILTDRANGVPAAVLADRYGLTVQHVTRLYRAAVVAVRAAMTD